MNAVRNAVMGTVLTVAILMAGGVCGADEERTETFDFTPGETLKIDLAGGGSVVVVGGDRDEARVVCFDTRRDLEDHRIRIQEKRGGLTITSEMIRGRNVSHNLSFEIRVPHRVDLDFYSMGGGLELQDLDGIFEGKTMGGSLVLENVEGRARLRTMGGTITVTDCRLDGKITTGGGEVLLENVVGDLEASSGGGDVRYKNVRDWDGRLRVPGGLSADGVTEDTVVISTAGGPIHVRRAPDGARLKTGGGEVWVDGASRFVEAWTGGGDMWIRVDDGWVSAWTGSGDVEVEVGRGLGAGERGVEVFSGTGDVTLILPKDLSMDLDLEIGYTRNSRKDYRIDSDWHVEVDRSSDWDYGNGSPRKYVWGRASVGGGEHLVKVRTVNGHIRIEKTR